MTEETSLFENLKSCADRFVAANIYKVLPEIGMNIAYNVGGNDPEDVWDIPGRIRRVEKECCYVREPKKGGNDFFVDLEKVIEGCDELPDVITVPDRINLEKLILMVSADIEDFADKVLALNSMV